MQRRAVLLTAGLLAACAVGCLAGQSADLLWPRPKSQADVTLTELKHRPLTELTFLPSFLQWGRQSTGASQAAHRPLYADSETLRELREENDWKNDLILFWLPQSIRSALPRVVHSWLRNWVACMALYFGVSGAWVYYAYWVFGSLLYKPGHIPPADAVTEQASVAVWAIPGYAVLPAVTEWVVEGGHTLAYSRVASVGLPQFLGFFALYMACVELCVYWTHRILHEHRPSYRVLHYIHHKYNKEHTLSPFAGLAFHPLDGILQALPYCCLLLFIPMHFLTFELLLFLTGIWTTNIHDCLHARVMPIMGAGYHSIHHTTYQHNYGHYFVYCDWLFGTLHTPEEDQGMSAKLQASPQVPVQ